VLRRSTISMSKCPDHAPRSRQKTGVVRRMSAVPPEHRIPRDEWEMTSRYEVDSRAL
jgi:hypothetical protein